MALIDNIISYWSMDEDHEAGGTRYDKVASNHLTDTNTVLSATGKLGTAADFERATAEYMQIAHASQTGLAVTGDLSVSAWVSVESAFGANYVALAKAHNSLVQGYSLICMSNGSVYFEVCDGTKRTSGQTATGKIPTNNTLKHIVATFDADGAGDKIKIYIDGTLETLSSSTNAASSINTGTNPFSIGARSDSSSGVGNHWDGKIDEVGVWSRVLSSTEVTELYNSGNGKQYPFGTILDTGFVAPTQIDDTGSHTAWTNKNNMMASDNAYATATTNNTRNWARNFGFSLASDAVIHGFEFSVEAFESANNGTTVRIQLSPDGGTSSSGEVVAALGESDTGAQTIGAPYQVMRRKWSATELNNTNLRVIVFSANGGTHGTVSLDQIRMKVYYSLLAVDVTVSGTVVTATFSQPAETVNFGSTISPSAQAATFNKQSPAVTGGAVVSPSALTASFSQPAIDVLTSDVLVNVGVQGLTASLAAPDINLDFVVAIAGALSASFSQPAAAIDIGADIFPSALVATFSQPAITGFVLDFVVSPSALAATFSTQAPTLLLLTQVDVGVVAALFSTQAPAIELGSVLSPSALSLTFSQPSLRLAGSVWRKTARNSTGSWTRSSRNST